jgi:MFS family permease
MNSLGVVIGTLSFGWFISTRLSVLRQLLLGAFVCGIGFMVMGDAHNYASLTLGGAINGLGCGLFLPATVGWALRTLPFERRGFGIGAFMASQFIGYFCNPILVMPMVSEVGSRFAVVNGWASVLIVLATVGFIGSCGTRYLKFRQQ